MNAQLVSGRLLIGILFIFSGVIIFLDQLNLLNVWKLVSTWFPLVLIGVGGSKLLTRNGSPLIAILLILVGAVLQLQRLDVFDIELGSLLLPIALIFGGAAILLGRIKVSASVASDTVNHVAIFGGSTERITSSDFKGGSVTAVFGGVELDLRDALLLSDCTLDATAVMGGVEIRVPKHWRVEVSSTPILGGVESSKIHPEQASPNSPILKINALAVMGGVNIQT